GIGSDLGEEGFKRAAAKTGGRYVITEDSAALTTAFTDLTAEIRNTAETAGKPLTQLQLTVKHRAESGRNLVFAGSDKFELPPLRADESVTIPASIVYRFRNLKSRYDRDIADLVTGDSVPVRDAQITKRIPIGVTGANTAAAINVTEALFLNRLRGVAPPSDKRFLALTMEMKNVLPVQDVRVYPDGSNHPAAWLGSSEATKGVLKKMVPTYLIPDLKRHLFLRWNQSQMVTLSPATWLAAAPLTLPGEDAVALGPKKPVRGTCVYLVPAEAMDQLSLHFYDMNYGHMDIPLVGTMPDTAERLSKLTPKPPIKLSDAFQIALREVKDVPKIGDFKAGDGMVFRIVEADFISNVQALLDVSPAERFSLRMTTQAGALHIPLHNATALLPLGFMSPTMLSPGSSNRIRLAFRVPQGIAKGDKGELVIDLKGGGAVIALGKNPKGKKQAIPAGKRLPGDGIDLMVNQVGRIDDRGRYQVVDITLFDKKDGESTSLSNAFILKRKDFKKADNGVPMRTPAELAAAKGLSGFTAGNSLSPVGLLDPDRETANRLFGFTEHTVVPDGQHLRGIIFFRLPDSDNNPADWRLASPFFKSLTLAMQPAPYKQEKMLAKRLQINVDPNSNYAQALEKALVAVVRERKAAAFEKPGRVKAARTDLENSGPPRMEVPVPDITAAGVQQFKDIRDIKTLQARLAKAHWLPDRRGSSTWHHRFAPEAVLTQNWGTEADFARMAEIVFARQGTRTRRERVDLTDNGRTALAKLGRLEKVETGTLPALVYYDSKGRKQLLVAPFMQNLRDLKGLATD
ncbi:MAG: hypothetical protein GY697_15505, partial [Desulfobacterales bacterium]|nr:hypothetical protein [Desulfobacterales bacterium]